MGNTYNNIFLYSKECLFSAVESSDKQWIELILKKNPQYLNEPMTQDCQSTPLARAVQRNDKILVEFLLQKGADINLAGNNGITPIMWACQKGNLDLIKFLFDNLANYSLESTDLFNAFDYAIIFGQYESALWLYNTIDGLNPKIIEMYESYREIKNIKYCDYKIFIDNLLMKIDFQHVPNFTKKPEIVPKYIDPVIDPRESWIDFLNRIKEFEDPPLTERDSLPFNLQPQNRFLGRLRSYLNGQNPNKSTSNQTNQNIEIKDEIQQLQSKEEKENLVDQEIVIQQGQEPQFKINFK